VSPKTALEYLSLWQLCLANVGLCALALETGYRLGKRRSQTESVERDSTVSATVGAILGLLGFILAMTFGVAMGQFDMRRQAFVDEVDAIGTAYLRADLLPPDLRQESRKLLREYVRARLYAVDSGNFKETEARSEAIHKQLWSIVVIAQDEVANPASFALYTHSIGEVIDVHTRRIVAGFQSRIPAVIWFVLLGVAALGMAEIGYQAGISRSARSPAHIVLIVSFAAILWLVADLDRPREGAIRVSQKSMRDLERMMNSGQ
jgi:hypothetical protein